MHVGRHSHSAHGRAGGFGHGNGHAFGHGGPQGKPGMGGPHGPQAAMGPGAPNGFNFGGPYTIKHGDTLWNISNRMRAGGDSRPNWDIINEIARDNGIQNPDLIYPGQTLNLRGPMGPDTFSPATDPGSPIQGVQGGAPAPKGAVPYINQYNPVGKDGSYTNAEQNCGPAVMAMIARSRGLGGGMSDADLIMSLGKIGQTGPDGTSGNGLIAMADQMGLKTEATPGSNPQWVMSQLAQGKEVIANGDFFALPQHADASQTSPHYILITGVDQNGNLMVKDPADPNVKSITLGQLDAYTRANPEGGFNISIG